MSSIPLHQGSGPLPEHEPNSALSAESQALPLPPRSGRGYIDERLAAELCAELAAAGLVREPPLSFDRAACEANLEKRSASAAEAEIAAARSRGALEAWPVPASMELSLDPEIRTFKFRGLAHYRENSPCQDAIAVRVDPASKSVFAVVSDGVSSVKLSHFGSALMSDALARIAEDLVTDQSGAFRESGSFLNANFLKELHLRMCGVCLDLCDRTGLAPDAAEDAFMAATLQLLIVTPRESAVLALGDGVVGWIDAYRNIDTVTQRKNPGYNTPPLIERVLIDEEREQQSVWRRMLDWSGTPKDPLVREAEAFRVVAYGATADVLPGAVELLTDGAGYTDVMPQVQIDFFPLKELAVTQQRSPEDIAAAVRLFHMYRLRNEQYSIEAVASAWESAEQAGDPGRPLGARLGAFLDRASPRHWNEAATQVRDFTRTVSGGTNITGWLRGNESIADVETLRDGLKAKLPKTAAGSFAAFLEERRSALEGTILEIAAELIEETGGGEAASLVAGEIAGLLRPSAEMSAAERADFEEQQAVLAELGDSKAFRMLADDPFDGLVQRQRVSGALSSLVPALLQKHFELDPGKLHGEVFDDVAWVAVGQKSDA